MSRTCLRVPLGRELPQGSTYPEGNNGLCTAECESDDDCDRVPESPCITGFTCGVAVTVGPFCCRKFCICKDYVVIPDSGQLATPMACDCDERGERVLQPRRPRRQLAVPALQVLRSCSASKLAGAALQVATGSG